MPSRAPVDRYAKALIAAAKVLAKMAAQLQDDRLATIATEYTSTAAWRLRDTGGDVRL